MRLLLCLTLSCCLVAACGSAPRGELADYNAKTDALNKRIAEYLDLSEDAEPLTTDEQWEAFLDEGSERTAALRTAFDDWSTSVDDMLEAESTPEHISPILLIEYEAAMEAWVVAMEQQLAFTRPCYPAGGDGAPDQDCFLEVMRANAAEWQAAGDKATQILQEMQAANS